MLNLDIKVDISLKEVHYPIYFARQNICVHCGAANALKFINIFGREVGKDIHPLESIRCTDCGAMYDIFWERDEDNDKFYPSAVDPSLKKKFIAGFKETFARKNLIQELN